MINTLRISAKNLGALAMPDFCPRCFWLKMRCQNRLPFQVFPGIFSSIDSYSKKITACCLERHGRLPTWFRPFEGLVSTVKVPHHSEFQVMDLATGILLTGVPDEICQREDGSYFIVDYKTARFTEHQDHLMPIYEVQLNAYAFIAERCDVKPVTGLGLVYYEPMTEIAADGIERMMMQDDGFMMAFRARLLKVELRPDSIPPLLREVRRVCDCGHAPDGRDGCGECGRVEAMVAAMW